LTFGATVGKTPRFFFFTPRPSLFCAVTVQENYKPPPTPAPTPAPRPKLTMLHIGNKQSGVIVPQSDAKFVEWKVEKNETVKKGDPIAVFEVDGKQHVLKAPNDGRVSAMLALKKGDEVQERMMDHTVAVIDNLLPEVTVEDAEVKVMAQSTDVFEEYHVAKGDIVKKGDKIATVTRDGESTPIYAGKDGVVRFLNPLTKGQVISFEAMDDTLAVIDDKLGPLKVDPDRDELPTIVDSTIEKPVFVKWLAEQGDFVRKGDPIAVVKDASGKEITIKAAQSGLVDDIQPLEKDDRLNSVMQDKNIATIRSVFPPLPFNESGITSERTKQTRVISSHEGAIFHSWVADIGDEVDVGDPIAKVMVKLDPTCRGTKCKMKMVQIKAAKGGIVEERQRLQANDVIEDKLMPDDLTIAVIGDRWPALPVDGDDVAVPTGEDPLSEQLADMEFCKFLTKPGQKVKQGHAVAEVSKTGCSAPEGARRLAANMVVKSPMNGCVKETQPLKPGQKIGMWVMGLPPKILSIGSCGGPPWWLWLLAGLVLLCCCLLLLLCCCRKTSKEEDEEQKESYVPLTQPEAPPTLPAPTKKRVAPTKPRPLRIDWLIDEAGNTRTTYASHRPLGILDDEAWEKRSKVAPLICRGFTFNSYAEHMGVQNGWIVAKIQDVDTTGHRNFAEVKELMNRELHPYPPWPLEIAFKVNGGETKTYKLTKKPLGIKYDDVVPIRVQEVSKGSYAEWLGIRDKKNHGEDWVLCRIGNVDLDPDKHNFNKQRDYLHDGTLPLDPWTEDGNHVEEDNIKGGWGEAENHSP